MKNKEKVSVVLPMFNAEDYVEKCIRSIISQTYEELEILVIDDGSLDDSYTIVDNMRKQDSRIVLLRNHSKGVSSARNTGIIAASGKWIMFGDVDDWVEDDLIEQLVTFAEKNDLEYVGSGYCEDNYVGKRIYYSKKFGVSKPIIGDLTTFSQDVSYVFRCNRALVATPWAKLYKKDMLICNNIVFNVHSVYAEDFEFNLRVLSQIKKYGFLPIERYHYYRNDIGSVDKVKNNIVNEVNLVYRAMYQLNQKYKSDTLNLLLRDCIFDLYKLSIRKMISVPNKRKRDAILSDLVDSSGFHMLANTFRIYRIILRLYSLHLKKCIYIVIKKRLLAN